MTTVWAKTRAEIRARWASTIALALLLGLAGAVVVAAVAGGRRTDTALERFRKSSNAADVLIDGQSVARAKVEHLPQVDDLGQGTYAFLSFPDYERDRKGAPIVPFAAADDHLWRTLERPKLLDGRMSDVHRADEVMISQGLAKKRGLSPGSHIRIRLYTEKEQLVALQGAAPPATGPRVDVVVAGVARWPQDIGQSDDKQDVTYLGGQQYLALTPAFWKRYVAPVVGPETGGFWVRLRHGESDLPAFRAATLKANGGKNVGMDPQSAQVQRAQRPLHVQAVALYLFAALAGLAAFLVLGQTLARQLAVESGDNASLAALGMTRDQLIAIGLLRTAVIALGGGVIAFVVGAAASGLFPVGFARDAEPHPGFDLNVLLVVGTTLVFVALMLARGAVPAWRAARARHRPEAGARFVQRLPLASLPPTQAAGVRLALEPGHGTRAVPLWSALAGTAMALAALLTVATFAASLNHLVDTPRLQGWNWDVVVGNPNSFEENRDAVAKLKSDPDVGEFASAYFGGIGVGKREIPAVGLRQDQGQVGPLVFEGRLPATPTEVLFGNRTLSELHRHVGDEIQARGPTGRRATLRIVGRGVFSSVSSSSSTTDPSDGAAMTLDGLRGLYPDGVINQYFVRYAPGVDHDATFQRLKTMFGPVVLQPLLPADVRDLDRVRWMPVALAVLLGVFALATLAHTLLTSVRRRSRDLALLKTLGFRRGQVSATVAWQATTLVVAALLVALPIGVAAGRVAWRIAATQLGVVVRPITPLVAIALGVPAALLVANLIAAAPGWLAGRVRPGVVLRSE